MFQHTHGPSNAFHIFVCPADGDALLLEIRGLYRFPEVLAPETELVLANRGDDYFESLRNFRTSGWGLYITASRRGSKRYIRPAKRNASQNPTYFSEYVVASMKKAPTFTKP